MNFHQTSMGSWPNGKALVFGTKNCRFESCRSRVDYTKYLPEDISFFLWFFSFCCFAVGWGGLLCGSIAVLQSRAVLVAGVAWFWGKCHVICMVRTSMSGWGFNINMETRRRVRVLQSDCVLWERQVDRDMGFFICQITCMKPSSSPAQLYTGISDVLESTLKGSRSKLSYSLGMGCMYKVK